MSGRVYIVKYDSVLHDIHRFHEGGCLERKNKRKPFPMANNCSDQTSGRGQEEHPPQTTVFFGLFHALEFWQK